MRQKIIWTAFLIIGFSLLFQRCEKDSGHYMIHGEHHYINKQDDTVFIFKRAWTSGPEIKYIILPSETLTLENRLMARKATGQRHIRLAYSQIV